MKIRKIFESMTDPDDMFEIFKDIVDDVLFLEFDRELDYEFLKGQILIDGTSIELEPGDDVQEFCYDYNWGFKFCMPDKREDKKRIKERIGQLFERQTGVKVGFYELGEVGYSHVGSEISVLCSKKEWITHSINLRDFEEITRDVELPERYSSFNIIDNFYYHKMSNKSLSLIVEVGPSMGMKIDFERPQLLNELNIKEDGDFAYNISFYPCCYYGGTWMSLSEKMDKVEVLNDETTYLNKYLNGLKSGELSKWRNYVDIDESLKMKLINASKELKSISNFTINLFDDSDDNLEVFTEFLCNQVFPKFETKETEQISQVEDQIIKLKNEDNIDIDYNIINRYNKDNVDYIVWLCETEYKKQQFIFKFTLNKKNSRIKIHSNSDKNNDGLDILECTINELSECIFLCLVDGKFQSK